MPDTEQIQVRMPDGKMWMIPKENLAKAQARGAKPVSNPSTFEKANARSFGFDTRKLQEYGPLEAVREGIKGFGDVAAATLKDPFVPFHALASGVTQAITPRLDTDTIGGVEDIVKGIRDPGSYSKENLQEKGGHLLGSFAQVAGGVDEGAAARAPIEIAGKVGDVAKRPVGAIHDYLGGDARSVERARSEHVNNMAELQLKNLQERNTAVADYEKAVKEAEEQHRQDVQKTGENNYQKEAAHRLKVEQIKQDHAAKVARDSEKYKQKVSEVQRKYEDEISAFNKPAGTKTASGDATGAELKRKTLSVQPRSGPVYQRLAGMADKVADNVTKLDKTVRTAYDANWNAWRHAMGDAEGDFTPVQAAVREAENNILKGSPESLAIFRNILKEGEDPLLAQAGVFRNRGGGVDVKDLLGSGHMSETTRNRVLQSLRDAGLDEETGTPIAEDVSLPIDQIRGYVTELQKKMHEGRFPSGDVYRALKYVTDAGNGAVERAIKAKNPQQLPIYNQLKSNWAQYLNDFYNRDGALTKLKDAGTSDARLNLITGSQGSNLIEALGRYAKFNPDVELPGRMRSLMKQLRQLPSSTDAPVRGEFPSAPAPRPEPRLPAAPTPKPVPEFKAPELKLPEPRDITPFDPQQFRKDNFQKVVHKFKTFGFDDKGAIMGAIFEISRGNLPLALSYPIVKRILASVMDRQSVEDWVARERRR